MKKDKRIKDHFIDISKVDKQYIVIGSDIHIPFQDDEAVRAFVDYCTDLQPKYIVLNGDILDMYRLSKFAKGEGRNPKYEIEMCRELLKTLRDACPDSEIYYVIGNHETRYEKYILERAPEIESLMDDIFTLIQTEKYKVTGVSSLNFSNQFIVTHGTFVAKYSGMSAIREFMNTFMSGASGHTHKLAKFSIRKRNREFFWLETGCLCGLDPEYMLYPDWQQGFGVVRIENGQISDGGTIPIKDGNIRWL